MALLFYSCAMADKFRDVLLQVKWNATNASQNVSCKTTGDVIFLVTLNVNASGECTSCSNNTNNNNTCSLQNVTRSVYNVINDSIYLEDLFELCNGRNACSLNISSSAVFQSLIDNATACFNGSSFKIRSLSALASYICIPGNTEYYTSQ
jgi:hypothetical protein